MLVDLLREVTRHSLTLRDRAELRVHVGTSLGPTKPLVEPAACVEPAARRRGGRIWDVATQDDVPTPPFEPWVRDVDGREQRRRVRVARTCKEHVPVGELHQAPRYITATLSLMCRTTDRSWEITRYAGPKRVLEVRQKIEDLGLDRDVECRHGLITHDE